MSKRFGAKEQTSKKAGGAVVVSGVPLVVTLPIPKMNPNKKARNYAFEHGRRASDAKKSRRAVLGLLNNMSAIEIRKLGIPWENAQITVDWYHKTGNHKDRWNIVDCLKGTLDGIVRAGILVDDDKLQPPVVNTLTDKEHPRIVVTLQQCQ